MNFIFILTLWLGGGSGKYFYPYYLDSLWVENFKGENIKNNFLILNNNQKRQIILKILPTLANTNTNFNICLDSMGTDQMVHLGWNVTPGGGRENLTKRSVYMTFENDYNNRSEWHIDFTTPSGVSKRTVHCEFLDTPYSLIHFYMNETVFKTTNGDTQFFVILPNTKWVLTKYCKAFQIQSFSSSYDRLPIFMMLKSSGDSTFKIYPNGEIEGNERLCDSVVFSNENRKAIYLQYISNKYIPVVTPKSPAILSAYTKTDSLIIESYDGSFQLRNYSGIVYYHLIKRE